MLGFKTPSFGRRAIRRLPTFTLTKRQHKELLRVSGIRDSPEFSGWFEELIRIAKFKRKKYQSEKQPVDINEDLERGAAIMGKLCDWLATLDPVVRAQLEQFQWSRQPEEPVKNPLPLPLARFYADAKVTHAAARNAADKFRAGRGARRDDLGQWLARQIILKFESIGCRPTTTADGPAVQTLRFALELLEGDSPDDKLQGRAQNRVREYLHP